MHDKATTKCRSLHYIPNCTVAAAAAVSLEPKHYIARQPGTGKIPEGTNADDRLVYSSSRHYDGGVPQ